MREISGKGRLAVLTTVHTKVSAGRYTSTWRIWARLLGIGRSKRVSTQTTAGTSATTDATAATTAATVATATTPTTTMTTTVATTTTAAAADAAATITKAATKASTNKATTARPTTTKHVPMTTHMCHSCATFPVHNNLSFQRFKEDSVSTRQVSCASAPTPLLGHLPTTAMASLMCMIRVDMPGKCALGKQLI